MFLFFSLRLSSLVTFNTTKRKEKKRTERYGTEVNSVQFIETSDFARNSNFLQISPHSYVNQRTTVPKFRFDLIEMCEAKRRINFFFIWDWRKFNLWHFIISRNSFFSLIFFFSYIWLIIFFFFFKLLLLKSRSPILQTRFFFLQSKKTSYNFGTKN